MELWAFSRTSPANNSLYNSTNLGHFFWVDLRGMEWLAASVMAVSFSGPDLAGIPKVARSGIPEVARSGISKLQI